MKKKMAKKQTSTYGQSIIRGLKEAVAHTEGKQVAGLRARRVSIKPIPHYKHNEIKRIRTKVQMTQKSFALFMGVSVKTIEAWENGRNEANGTAQRMLYLLDKDKQLPEKYAIVA